MVKKLLYILTVYLVFTSCSPDRVLIEELTNIGTEESPLFYYNGELFTGVEFDVYPNGELKSELHIQDGKYYGLLQNWYENGQLKFEGFFRDNKQDGLWREWHSNGQLKSAGNFKDGEQDGLHQEWDENGQLIEESNWNDGVRLD